MHVDARRYASSGYKTVQGWLTREAALAILTLANAQERMGITGGAAEIGVHHGRLLVLLALLLRDDEQALGIDLFDMQAENVDGSGKGSQEQVVINIKRHGADSSRVTLLAENSLRVTPTRVREITGPVRLFSVDGGHTAAITYSDLCLARDTLCEGGLLILDDYMNQRWPGVTEGACRFMLDSPLEPVGFISNKLILANGDAEPYRSALSGTRTELFGRPAVVSRELNTRERLASTSLWRVARDSWAGRLARRLI